MRPLNLAYNPTSWADGAPVPGGMADCLIQPYLPHLDVPYVVTNCPLPGHVNTYYTFPGTYGLSGIPGDSVSVFISHGIADKAWRNNTKVRSFDWVFVSGPAWTRRLVLDGYPPDRIIEAGYPKLDPIVNGTIESPWAPRDGRIRVVYAPTHGGGGEKYRNAKNPPGPPRPRRTSHWAKDEILSLLPPDRFDVRLALHPRHRADGRSTLAEYVGAGVVIADGGSTIYEAWALDLPVVFPSWVTAEANIRKSRPSNPTFEGTIYRDQIGYHAEQPADLAELVATAAAEGIDDAAVEFTEAILPRRYRGRSGQMHGEALTDIVKGGTPRHRADVEMVTFRHVQTGKRRAVAAVRRARYDQSNRWEVMP